MFYVIVFILVFPATVFFAKKYLDGLPISIFCGIAAVVFFWMTIPCMSYGFTHWHYKDVPSVYTYNYYPLTDTEPVETITGDWRVEYTDSTGKVFVYVSPTIPYSEDKYLFVKTPQKDWVEANLFPWLRNEKYNLLTEEEKDTMQESLNQ